MNHTKTPKTPSRSRSKSTPKSSLMSLLDVDFVNLTLGSPTKNQKAIAGDITNPFLNSGQSRPSSPVKKATGFNPTSAELKRQASMGVLKKGSVESRMEVIFLDHNLPKAPDMKRSKSQPASKVCLKSIN
jgi:cell division cycle 20, cofactor of APC complex